MNRLVRWPMVLAKLGDLADGIGEGCDGEPDDGVYGDAERADGVNFATRWWSSSRGLVVAYDLGSVCCGFGDVRDAFESVESGQYDGLTWRECVCRGCHSPRASDRNLAGSWMSR